MRQLSRQRNKPGPGVVLSPRRCADRLEIVATCAGAPLAGSNDMRRHLASLLAPLGPLAPGVALVALLALAPGCKSMGGVMSGLGKVAAGAAHGVARVAPAVARGMAKTAPVVARAAARTAPSVLRATEAVVEVAADAILSTPIELDLGPGIVALPAVPPGADDPCQTCPVDDCGACAGYAGYACVASPAGALARCESSAPPDAAPAPEPPAAAPFPPPAAAPSAPPSSTPPPPPAMPPAPASSFRS
jgi:hypothetical protein